MTAQEYLSQTMKRIRDEMVADLEKNSDRPIIKLEDAKCSICGEPIGNHDH